MPKKATRAEVTSHARPLWAPWRMKYIVSSKADGCFLCAKSRGDDLANHVVARGERVFALLNTFPYNSGHVLVAPYRHVADLDLLEPDERRELLDMIIQAKATMAKVMQPQGFNIGFNIGEIAGAGVADHVHGHIVPRWAGDTNFMPVLGDLRVVPQALEDTAELLRQAWRH